MKTESKPHPVAETLTHAMRRFVSSVTVISLREPDGSRNAITATSSTSVSMAPPSIVNGGWISGQCGGVKAGH